MEQLPTTMPDMTPSGRPAKYSAQVHERIIQAVRMGATIGMACNYALISQSTYDKWRRQVRTKDMTADHLEEKAALFDDIEKAKGEAALYWLGRIEDAAKTEWRAAAWKLERKYPNDFGNKSTIQFDQPVDEDGSQQQVGAHDLSLLSDDKLDVLLSIMEEARVDIAEHLEVVNNE